jgi:hypothetical protein
MTLERIAIGQAARNSRPLRRPAQWAGDGKSQHIQPDKKLFCTSNHEHV